jgi:hypothetical protein
LRLPTLACHCQIVKKFAAIILICSLFFTLLGYHFIYRIRLENIKSEMRAGLRSPNAREVVTLFFNNEERLKLEWEDGKEIRFNNEMYDVIDTITAEHQLVIRCIPDKKEKELLVAYQKLQDDAPSPIQTRLVKLMSSYFIPCNHYQITIPISTVQRNYTLYTPGVCMPSSAVPERPPCFS